MPPGMSAEAREFLRSAEPLPPPPSSLEELRQLRIETKEGFRAAAEEIREECIEDIEETTLGGVRTWRVRPKRAGTREAGFCILYFFGGGFIQGSPFEDLPVIGRIAQNTGADVYVPWYRLSPEHPYPAAQEDGLAAYKELVERVGERPFAVMGESAGGNLALATLMNARDAQLRFPAVLALLSPWSDLTSEPDSLVTNDGHDPTLTSLYIDYAASAYRGVLAANDPAISPVYGAYSSEFPSTIITTGTRDLLLSHSLTQARVMEDAGIDVTLRVWDGMWHVFEFYPNLPEAALSLGEVADHMVQAIKSSG